MEVKSGKMVQSVEGFVKATTSALEVNFFSFLSNFIKSRSYVCSVS